MLHAREEARSSSEPEAMKKAAEWMTDAHFQGGGECCRMLIEEIQRDALESAAQECESESTEAGGLGFAATCRSCARAVRALTLWLGEGG